jgi:sugar phosphate isomerase/epimerase
MRPVYVSSSAFHSHTVLTIVQQCLDAQIEGLELGANIKAFSSAMNDHLSSLVRTQRINLLIHNYFPPPEIPFVLNLGSCNSETLDSSLVHCMRAIDMCDQYNIPFYSIHAGFCFDVLPEQLGQPLTPLNRVSIDKTESIFIESLQTLSDHAARFDIAILVENHVLEPYNLIEGRNKLLLGVTAKDLIRYIKKVGRSNLFILLDVGHLKITATTLGLNPYREIEAIAPFIRAVHLSDNNGYEDAHDKVNRDSWFWKPLKEYLRDNSIYYILEVQGLTHAERLEQVQMIERHLYQ